VPAFRPIAIVGQACLLPGAHSPAQLWSGVLAGRDFLSRATASTWQVADKARVMRTGAEAPAAEKIPSDRGGYVTGFEGVFDPALHAIEGVAVAGLDPLFQWLLHVGREAFIDAGLEPAVRTRGGAIIGNLSYPTYGLNDFAASVWAKSLSRGGHAPAPDPLNRFMSGLPVGLLCESLQLTRGGFMVDAACASSLYAIKYACDWLADGRADVMLAGGVTRVHGLTIHAGFTTLQALSPSGRSRPLHAQADGLVPSEGAAVVVLKRLDDALRDGSRILGVIRGVGLANDGRGSGLLVPSAAGQVRAMEAAYRESGLRPADIDLIECHATGTVIGDTTEIQSCAQIFRDRSRIALGSLKANLGHLLPVAGVAGLIKVLQSMEHGLRPAIPHLDELNPALAGTPLAPTLEPTEWPTSSVRRAAVNAFGFGGNNAHLLVEQAPATTGVSVSIAAPRPPAGRCAVVAVAARMGNGADADDFWRTAVDGANAPAAGAMREIRVPLAGLVFPPQDLEQTLAQQVVMLEVTQQALAQVASLPFERTAVFVGMGCDAEACRFGLNLRLAEFLAALKLGPVPPAQLEAARQALIPGPFAATTLGLMPNVVANRLNRQHGCGGASCAVSAEQLSGLRGLELATRALRAGDIDGAIVGAVDMGAEPVHTAALAATRPADRPVVSDGACVLILKREEDAKRDGDTIFALIDTDQRQPYAGAVDWTGIAEVIQRRCGYCHAADALLQVASAALALQRQLLPNADGAGAEPWPTSAGGSRIARIEIAGLRDEIAEFFMSGSDVSVGTAPTPTRANPSGKFLTFAAHRPPVAEILASLLVPAPAGETAVEPMLRPPPLRPVLAEPEDMGGESEVVAPSALVDDAPDADPAAGVAQVHEVFLTELSAAHASFLQSVTDPAFATVDEPAEFIAPAKETMPESSAADAWAVSVAPPDSPVAAAEAPIETVPLPGGTPVGPTFSRAELEHLASGRISDLFGPAFAGQDGFHRQVRMPMPPMLLADRVTGIDAPPGELGRGTIWTETDVRADAWYVHQGHVPLGITIESGQADLLLISWMGIDLLNCNERVYRLLGCEATIKGPLPKVGDTLKFDIHIDGHAQLGGIRMFFFHSDLRVNDEVRLSVRHGQAGFFTDEELAHSEGVLWDADTEAPPPLRPGATAAPAALTKRKHFNATQVTAFAAGRARECFGPGFEWTETHTRTPRIQSGRVCFIDEVTAFDAAGGPWRRGYLRAVKAIRADEWFFEGHFKNDPCMPGTLMLEGAVQAMEFFLTALGCTLRRDGWRFQAAQDRTMQMRCRGQCVPTSRELVYEVYVEEFIDGAAPQLRASVMASVDGRKAFLCQGLTVELVQDWPLDEMLRTGEVAATQPGVGFDHHGFAFDHRSLLACALGPPSEGFGPQFTVADRPLLLPRLPRPPYHFMTRIAALEGVMGQPAAGMAVESEFDFRARDWYFARSGNGVMPGCVFMEALLQPCGWLASFARDPGPQQVDIYFRNLDGTLTWQEEIPAQDGTLRVRAELTHWSDLGNTIIVGFRVTATLQGRALARMDTVFGFFPGDAFANQAGLPATANEQAFLARAGEFRLELRGATTDAFSQPGAPLAAAPLLMLDRITGWWPQAGEAGLGIASAETDVRAAEWFFKAHFMQDPVQPGSLGIEALLQLLQAAMRLGGIGKKWGDTACFEPVALGEPLTWKYRGQVVPSNGRIQTFVELLKIEPHADEAITVRARGSLWVDGKKIYETSALAMRVLHRQPADAPPRIVEKEFSFALAPWLDDHRPSFTSAVVPLTVMLDELAAATAAPGLQLTRIGAFAPARWLVCPPTAALKLRLETGSPARLSVWRESNRAALSRYDEVGAATLEWSSDYSTPPEPLPPLVAPLVTSPYETGETTHGPAFQVLRELRRSAAGASCRMDAGAGTVPVGMIHPALLDGCTHGMPLSHLDEWFPDLAANWNALPRGVEGVCFFGPTPTRGEVRCEIRPEGLAPDSGHPRVYVQFIVDGRVWCDLRMQLALLDGQAFVGIPYSDRRDFMRRRAYHPIRFSHAAGNASTWDVGQLGHFQWMPQQLETLFQLPDGLTPERMAVAITAKEHVAHELAVHPAQVTIAPDDTAATLPEFPLQSWPIACRVEAGRVEVRSAGEPDFVSTPGETLFAGSFLADLSRALKHEYVRRFRVLDPAALEPLKSRPFIICANHQTAIESMLFTEMFTRWSGLPVTTVTRTEHAGSWMGRLTDFLWRHPHRTVAVNPQLLFTRERPEAFFDVIEAYQAAQPSLPHSLHLHVEGEQALTCRQRVKRMSAVIVDLALALDLPILPLKYSGGLPVEPLAAITSFPVAYGKQDYTLGRPLLPADLRRMPGPKAAEWVVEAINAIPPATESEIPLPGRPGLAAEIHAWRNDYGITEIQAAVLSALRHLPNPSEATRSILAYPVHGRAGLKAGVGELDWLHEVANWLWGADDRIHGESEHWKRTARH
jgi:3-oxoacyl-(acyl-carrier-protein) synthase/3-hydroxymyristoyl/3-hydroxydecanoyl-(acyl carrier protein) dehydratase